MKAKYHSEITQQALSHFWRPEVLETVIAANLGQDALRFQFGYDHFHYDSNFFIEGDAYCNEQRQIVMSGIKRAEMQPARQAFGRLTHAVQDLYAHSNYVMLWRKLFPDSSAWDIDPEKNDILQSPELCSGKLYYPLELLSFVDGIRPFILPFLPRDSHAWMNMDDPSRTHCEFAFAAAVKRTGLEFQRILVELSNSEAALFTGQDV